ncbi:MAG: hypothetical protein KDJ65_36095 [Anaerolineae bacterium]|nr:hypothetical protein [Anaerolineae bacterium]
MSKSSVYASNRHQIVLPEVSDHLDLMALNDDFLTYDATLPPENQSAFTKHLMELGEQCKPHHDQFYSSEAQRSIASDNVKRLDEEVIDHLKQAQHNLNALFWRTPSEAEAWGFKTKQSTGNIIAPATKKERMRVLDTYIAKEESMPEAERFNTPDLARLIEVRDQLVENTRISRSNEKQRRSSRVARDESFRRLRDTLRMAAGNIIILQFDHAVTHDLQKWGFSVIERSSKSETGEEEVIIDQETTSDTDYIVETNGHAETNGSLDVMLSPVLNGDAHSG